MSIKIIIAGGGTGGHIFPAVAVANAIMQLQPGASILFVGAKGKMEMEKIPQAGYKIIGIDITGFNRHAIWKNFSLPFKLIKSFMKVHAIIKQFKPDAVFGVGGYSSYPVLRVAQLKGIKTYLHESNAFAGKSNVMLGKKATKIFVAAAGMDKFFPKNKIVISGNPVRKSIVHLVMSSADAKANFNLDSTKFTLLIIGGSLGAQSINEAIELGLERLLNNELQLIWQTGKPYAARAAAVSKGRTAIWVNEFISDMASAYAAADVVISRSGAMSVTELCFAAKPVIFVPYPFAAEDHQTANAMALVNQNAALLIPNDQVKNLLVDKVLELVSDKNKRQELSQNIKHLARANADETIANYIIDNAA